VLLRGSISKISLSSLEFFGATTNVKGARCDLVEIVFVDTANFSHCIVEAEKKQGGAWLTSGANMPTGRRKISDMAMLNKAI
jgi:hypothetical protein